jgi:4-hydroxy-tetrahydrodipicolinate synthase
VDIKKWILEVFLGGKKGEPPPTAKQSKALNHSNMPRPSRSLTSLLRRAPRPESLFRGVFPVMATPFHPDETLDVASFRRAIAFMARTGARGITVLGALGESNRLTDAEREVLIRAAVEGAAEARADASSGVRDDFDFPVCVGTSHPGTAACVALCQMAAELGADAVMIAPHHPADESILTLYSRVAESCPGLPICLQDHPASSGVNMTTSLVARIASEVPSIACVKLESLPSPSRIARLRELWSDAMPPAGGRDVAILAGLGAAYSGFEIEEGIDGYMTGFAFPEILVAMCDAARGGDVEKAHAIYSRYLPLVIYEGMSPGVALRKELYRMRGLVDCAIVRHPAEGWNISLGRRGGGR